MKIPLRLFHQGLALSIFAFGAFTAPALSQTADTSAAPAATAPSADGTTTSAASPAPMPAGNTTPPPAPKRPAPPAYHPPTYQEILDDVLRTSVNLGRTDYIERLLQLGANISAHSIGYGDQTPLYTAVQQGNATLVDFLLNHGADPIETSRGEYPLDIVFDSHADLADQIKILRLLMAHGADINQHGKGEYPLIVDAFETDKLGAVLAVLDFKPDLTALTPGGQTVTYMAATYGKASFLDVILVAGGNYTPTLGTAAALGDLTLVDKMLADGADPNEPDSRKVQPIVFAAFGGHTDVVESLLAAGADKNTAALTRALHQAVEHHNRDVAALLVRAGADINANGDSRGNPTTPIMLAAADGNLTLVKMLDDAGANRDGALFAAANNGHADVVSFLLDQGADAHERNTRKITVLDAAAVGGHIDILQLLFKKTPQGFASDELNQALAGAISDLLLYHDNPNGETPYNANFADTADHYRQSIAYLIGQGAVYTPPPRGGIGSFTRAIEAGDASLVSLLLDKAHADPNAADKSYGGASPLYNALWNAQGSLPDRLAVLSALLDHGANTTVERPGPRLFTSESVHGTPHGTASPLDDVLTNNFYPGKREAVQLLLAHGATFNAQGGNLSEGLIRAVAVGDQPKVRQLLAAGADVNMKFRNGWTPFLVAVAVGDYPLAKLLLDAKADPKAELVYPGTGVLPLAVTSENPDLIRLAYALRRSQHISSPMAMILVDRLHSPEAAAAIFELSSSPEDDAHLAFFDLNNRTTLPPTTGLILAHLHPITPADNPDAKPAPSAPASTNTAQPTPPTAN